MPVLVPLVLGFAASIDYMKAASARYEAQTKAGEKHRGIRPHAARLLDRASPGRDSARPREEGQGLG